MLVMVLVLVLVLVVAGPVLPVLVLVWPVVPVLVWWLAVPVSVCVCGHLDDEVDALRIIRARGSLTDRPCRPHGFHWARPAGVRPTNSGFRLTISGF